jgi:UPF0716 family protein affecting phage T7 exclusion
MSAIDIFIVAALMLVIASFSIGLLIWGAILDGRAQRAIDEELNVAEMPEQLTIGGLRLVAA